MLSNMDKLTKIKMVANLLMIVPPITMAFLHQGKMLIGWGIGYIATLIYAVVREIDREESTSTHKLAP